MTSTPNRWFRLYDELLEDPKVQMLDAETFRAWINLLCLANRHGGILPDEATICFALRIDNIGARSLLDRLRIATLIDPVKGGRNGKRYAIHSWSKRQYKSDGSTERVKRFRERSKAVSETPPESETEAERNTPLTPRQNGGAGEGQSASNSEGSSAQPAALKPEHLVEAWNDLAERTGLAPVGKLTNGRLRKVEALIAGNSVDAIGRAIDAIEASAFLQGKAGEWNGATFDWLVNEDNFAKITEGNYDQSAH